jgi:hypothetical protein
VADAVEIIIDAVQAEFERLRQLGSATPLTKVRYGIGNLYQDKNSRPPRICWIEQGGQCDPGQMSEFEEPTIGTDIVQIVIEIWGETLEQCRSFFNLLRVATRNVMLGPNVVFTAWSANTQIEGKNLDAGEVFLVQCQIKIPVPAEAPGETQYVVAEAHEHSTHIGESDEDCHTGEPEE